MKKLLIICFSEIENDPRVLKQLYWTKDDYDVTVAGFGDYQNDSVSFIKIDHRKENIAEKLIRKSYMAAGQYDKFYWSLPFVVDAHEKLKDLDFDIIIANELQSLPLAVKLKENAKIVFDAHEFYLSDIVGSFVKKHLYKKYAYHLLKSNLQYISLFTTSSDGFSSEYNKLFGVKPVVFPNVPFYHDIKPKSPDKDIIKCVHHGAADAERNLEAIIEGIGRIREGFELHLYLLPSVNSEYRYIKKLVNKYKNVFLHNPIPYNELIAKLNNYDLGIFLLKPVNEQAKFALPNKIFEFIQARLGVIIAPHPEMERIVKKYDVGLITKGYSSADLIEALKSLTPERIYKMKKNSHKIAPELTAENYRAKYLQLLSSIL